MIILNNISGGRHVPTANGDQVFIPRLNLDDQWSIEDPQHQQEKSLELKVDKSCQTVELLKNFKIFDKKKGKYKSKVSSFLKKKRYPNMACITYMIVLVVLLSLANNTL